MPGTPCRWEKIVEQAVQNGVTIGAHPGFNDREGVWPPPVSRICPPKQLTADLTYQIGALQGIARSRGGKVSQVKLHGALANMACEDFDLAQICVRAVLACDPALHLVVMPKTELEKAANAQGCRTIGEIYADRSYSDDATLVSRDRAWTLLLKILKQAGEAHG